MKSFHISLFNSVNEFSKESRLAFRISQSAGRSNPESKTAAQKKAAAEAAKKAAAAAKGAEADKKATETPLQLKTQFQFIATKWRDKSEMGEHTDGFKGEMEGILQPVESKLTQYLQEGLTKKEVKQFGKDLARLEAKAKLAVKNDRVKKVKKKAKTAKEAVTEDSVKTQLTEQAKGIPAIQQLKGKLQDTAIAAVVTQYAGKIYKAIHKKIDGIVKALGSVKDVAGIKPLETQITEIYRVTKDKATGIEVKSAINSPAIDNVHTMLEEYAKSIIIVLDASGQGFKNAGIDITTGEAKTIYNKWKTKLIGMLRTGKTAPKDFIAETKTAQTHIIAASILGKLSKEKKDALVVGLIKANLLAKGEKLDASVFVRVLGNISTGYSSLEGEENKKTQALQAVAKLVQKYIGKIPGVSMTIEGGADSETIQYGEHTLPRLKNLRALAQKFISLKPEQLKAITDKNPQLASHFENFKKLAGLTDAVGPDNTTQFKAFLESANKNDKGTWFEGGGVFNALLSLERAQNIAGDMTKTDSLFYQANCNVFAKAATGKVDKRDRKSRIGLELNISVKGSVEMPKAPKEQLALKENAGKVAKRKAGVQKRVNELGGKSLDDSLKIDGDPFFASLNENGGLDEAGWAKGGQEYVRAIKFQDQIIYFGINTSPPHDFTAHTDGVPKILSNNSKSLQHSIQNIKAHITYKNTTGKLSIAQGEKVNERKKAVNAIIAKLGGKSMKKPISISGLTFRFDITQDADSNWENGDGGIVGITMHRGKEIYFNISMSEPHAIHIYDEVINSPYKAKLEKALDARKTKIDSKLIAARKKGIQKKLAKITGIKDIDIFQHSFELVEGLTFKLEKDYDSLVSSNRSMMFTAIYGGKKVQFGIDATPPHGIHVGNSKDAYVDPLKGSLKAYVQAQKDDIDRPKKGAS